MMGVLKFFTFLTAFFAFGWFWFLVMICLGILFLASCGAVLVAV